MKNLVDFMNEALILELSSDTYLAAAKKAQEIGDSRFEKFLKAYAEEVKKESDGEKEQLNEYYKQDKSIFIRLNKLGESENNGRTWRIDGYLVTPMLADINGSVKYPFLPRVFPKNVKFPWPDASTSNPKYFVATIGKKNDFGFLIYEYPSDRVAFEMSPIAKSDKPSDEFKEVIAKVLNAVSNSSKSYDDYNINKWRV